MHPVNTNLLAKRSDSGLDWSIIGTFRSTSGAIGSAVSTTPISGLLERSTDPINGDGPESNINNRRYQPE